MSKTAKPATMAQRFEDAARELERNAKEESDASKRVAWRVAGVALGVAVVSMLGATVSLFLRKAPEPLVFMPGDKPGDLVVYRSVKNAQDKYGEVIDKHWTGKYTCLRLGYDWFTISTDSAAVKLMSTETVARDYEFNPVTGIRAKSAPLNVLRDQFRTLCSISSVTFVGDLAQVRYTLKTVRVDGQDADKVPERPGIATLAYRYDENIVMTDQQRQANPLGLKVESFRSDSEIVK